MSIRGFCVAVGLVMLLGGSSFAPAQQARRSPFAEGRKLPGDLSDLLRVTDEPEVGRPASEPKATVPTAADQAKTLAKIEEIFGRPKSSAEKAKLSGEMLVAGSSEKDEPTRYVLFRYAGSLALEAKNLKGALAAVDRLERGYDIDALTMKAGVLDRLLARDTAADVLAAAQQAYGEAIRPDHYDAAARLGGVAYAAARRLKKRELLNELKAQAGRLGEMKKALAAIRPAIATLNKTPDDVDANRRVGEYLCFSKGELSRGLPLLAKGKHELAELDRSAPVDADRQRRLGDGWWVLAAKHRGPVRTALQQHAAGWYRRALPQLKGLTKIKLQKRVDEVAKLAAQPGKQPMVANPGKIPVGKWVDVLQVVEFPRDGGDGHWRRIRTAIQFDGFKKGDTAIRIPIDVKGNYDLSYTFTRSTGKYALPVDLPLLDRTFQLRLGSGDGKIHGIQPIDGRAVDKNESRIEPGTLVNGRTYRVDVSVRVDAKANTAFVGVLLDGKPIIRWRGKRTSLGESGPVTIGIHGYRTCHQTYHSMALRLIDGEASFHPGRAPK